MAKARRRELKPARRFVRVLFLSTGNAARSQIAEAILQSLAGGAAAAASAGMTPLKQVHPMALASVRNVFNGHIEPGQPKAVQACGNDAFDYVFTLTEEAARSYPSFPNRPVHIHWPIEDPTATQGTHDQRQRAFDRVTRKLLKRLRAWWRSPEATTVGMPIRPRNARRPNQRAQWRTGPGVDAPILAVAYYGPIRSCINMCAHLERSGFWVLCGERYGKQPDSIPIVPDVMVVRVDGAGDPTKVRAEFDAVRALKRRLARIPMLMLVDQMPSATERQILTECETPFLERQPQSGRALIEAIRSLISHPRPN